MHGAPVRILAVVLTYQPDFDTLRAVVAAVLPQVHHVLLVDNASARWPHDLQRRLPEAAARRLSVLRQRENLGVGAGHNVGIEWARSRGFSHVLLLDQDSVPAHDMVRRLTAGLIELEKAGARVACVGPRYVDPRLGHSSRFVRLGLFALRRAPLREERSSSVVAADFLISSGALIPLAVIEDVGAMDEGLFIDHVDTEWMLRARSYGYRAFGVPAARMQHRLGEATIRFWLGRWRHLPWYRPERHYYVFRNSLVLYWRPGMPRAWRVNDALRLLALAILYPLLAQPRLERLAWIARGIRDGLLGRKGPITPPAAGATPVARQPRMARAARRRVLGHLP